MTDQDATIASLREHLAHWKANHARELEVNRTLRDRPDLGDRAKRVQGLIEQLSTTQRELDEARAIVEKQARQTYT